MTISTLPPGPDRTCERPTRRRVLSFLPAAVVGVPLLAACNNGVGSSGAATIDARVQATLAEMYRTYPNTRDLAAKASGMLVMPLVTEAGFWLGGGYGRGALLIDGATVDYYATVKGSAGFQIGVQQYAHVLFFMTDAALNEFRRSSGWAVGADANYTIIDKGDGVAADSNTLRAPILAAVFGQAGLQVGATLEGTKYTRVIP
ncbi:YSC84-related protein [Chachezhania antarctica]|uniref:lipid-binding SYLF domain-containing protein n=1 Tax=Chachezhania antarctica TaxID=2340860 RepID=UPI000EB38B21|nr:YSC84-related protein [Chachezhania antarctica]